jgi:hypothetical protein
VTLVPEASCSFLPDSIVTLQDQKPQPLCPSPTGGLTGMGDPTAEAGQPVVRVPSAGAALLAVAQALYLLVKGCFPFTPLIRLQLQVAGDEAQPDCSKQDRPHDTCPDALASTAVNAPAAASGSGH